MTSSRLSLALDGALTLPEGPVAVFGPLPGFDLSSLARGQVTIVSRFFPDAEAWKTAGYTVAQTSDGPFAAALVVLPRAKEAARALIAEASAAAPLVIVDGQKHDGIDSMLKAVRLRHPLAGTLSKAHGKLFWITGASFADWAASDRRVEGGLVTRPGVFSADGPDKGSRALLAVLPPLKGRVGDLGAGWGYLARHVLAANEVSHLDLIEADSVALDCARANLPDPRVRFVWADATRFTPEAPYDVVVSNPPFHVGRAGDPGLGKTFIAAAARMLTPRGDFWMVANRHLPYEETLAGAFHHVEEVGGGSGFKIFHASHPSRRRA